MKNLLFSRKFGLLFLFFLINGNALWSQTNALNPCGTPPKKSVWLDKYQQSPELYDKAGETLIYIPLTIHIVGTDEGVGYFSINQVLDALCTLNNDFAAANIFFYIQGAPDYINNTGWFDHETVIQGAEMMAQNDVAGTLNCYFVSNPAGNCGYNLPYASIAINNSCAGPHDHTWSHETGHALSLPHPFLGWEGGQTHDGSMPPVFTAPAPSTVTYDYTFFQDTLILDTLIIDTAYVELVDQSNCHIAADGFCDTPPDYIAARWQCNSNGVSTQEQTDPNGALFRSDGSLIMSYSDDACANRFSDEQIDAMRANALDEHTDWLGNEEPLDAVTSSPTLTTPIEGETAQYNQVFLEWEPVEHATTYIILVSRLSSFNAALTETFISHEPNMVITSLLDNKNYYWKVRAYNEYSSCTEFSSYEVFHTENMVGTQNIQWRGKISLNPTLLNKGETLNLKIDNHQLDKATIEIINTIGQSFLKEEMIIQKNNTIRLPATLTPGIYFLAVQAGENKAVFRILVL